MNIEMKKHTLRRILTEGLWAADERSVSSRVSEHLWCLGVWMCGCRRLKEESVWRIRVFKGESEWFGWVLVSKWGECLIWLSESECESDRFECFRVSVRVIDLSVWEWVCVWKFESDEWGSVWKLESDEWGLKIGF